MSENPALPAIAVPEAADDGGLDASALVRANRSVAGRGRRFSWRRRLRWSAGRPYRAAKRLAGYWRRRLRTGSGTGYRDGRTLKNGVRLCDCEVDGSPGWACEHCCTAEFWEYGDQGDPVAEALTMASAWMHRCGTWNPAPIVAAFECNPATLRWDGGRLVLTERVGDPAPPDSAVACDLSADVEGGGHGQ